MVSCLTLVFSVKPNCRLLPYNSNVQEMVFVWYRVSVITVGNSGPRTNLYCRSRWCIQGVVGHEFRDECKKGWRVEKGRGFFVLLVVFCVVFSYQRKALHTFPEVKMSMLLLSSVPEWFRTQPWVPKGVQMCLYPPNQFLNGRR